MLVAVCLTATMALADETTAAPDWWPTFTFSDEKPQSNHDAPDWWQPPIKGAEPQSNH